jgi:hypothetical protein
MSSVKSSGPATSYNSASQGSISSQGQQGAGVGGAATALGIGNLAAGGHGFNAQDADQYTTQALGQASDAISANSATDNIEANTTINFGGNVGVF